jgi:hypothetical protein
MMAQARRASRQAPKAQKKDMTMMARPRTAVGRNSAYKVHDCRRNKKMNFAISAKMGNVCEFDPLFYYVFTKQNFITA